MLSEDDGCLAAIVCLNVYNLKGKMNEFNSQLALVFF